MAAAQVYQLLQQAQAGDPVVRGPAEQQLLAWEAQPGFCTCLAVREYWGVIYF